MPGPLPNSNGVSPNFIRAIMGILERHGLATVLALGLTGVVIWLWVADIRANTKALTLVQQQHIATELKQDKIEAEVKAVQAELKALTGILNRAVLVLESIDRQMCIANASTVAERRACVVPQ